MGGIRKLKLHIADPPNRKHMVFLGGAVLADIMKVGVGTRMLDSLWALAVGYWPNLAHQHYSAALWSVLESGGACGRCGDGGMDGCPPIPIARDAA